MLEVHQVKVHIFGIPKICKFSQNTTNLLSIKVATCFDSRSHYQAN